ncbi:hypothetical protein Tco_0311224, partial [Tanacetum coccineum]
REQDSFLVIKLSGNVVQYNLISKTLHEIYDCESNQVDDNHDDNDDVDDDDDDELLQHFQAQASQTSQTQTEVPTSSSFYLSSLHLNFLQHFR